MVKRYVPEPGEAIAALAARLDLHERRLGDVEALRADVAALGHGVADLTGQVRRLAATGQRAPAAGGAADAPAPASSDEEGNGPGQPEWTTVADPALATEWLLDAKVWMSDVLGALALEPNAPCWPLHPSVVAELLALAAEHRAAYAGPKPTAVSEWLARWLPGAAARIAHELEPCLADRGHRQRGRVYRVERLDLVSVATWWVDTHGENPDAVEAFALSPAL